MTRTPLALTLILLLWAQASATAQNLVTNPTFDVDVSGWESIDPGVTADHTDSDGLVSPGAGVALDLIDNTPFFPITGMVQCLDIAPTGPLVVQGAGKAVNYPPGTFRVILTSYSMAGCPSIAAIDSEQASLSAAQGFWMEAETRIAGLPGGTASIRIGLFFDASAIFPDAETRFDDVYVGPEIPLFADGFEDGDLTGWTAASP